MKSPRCDATGFAATAYGKIWIMIRSGCGEQTGAHAKLSACFGREIVVNRDGWWKHSDERSAVTASDSLGFARQSSVALSRRTGGLPSPTPGRGLFSV